MNMIKISEIEQTQQQLRTSIEQSKRQAAKSDQLIKTCRDQALLRRTIKH